MASLHKHPRSPFWILRYRDVDTGAWKAKSTGLRHGDDSDTRKARKRELQESQREDKEFSREGSERRQTAAFSAWVPSFLETHYRNAHSLKRYMAAWQNVREFLAAKKLWHPASIRYVHGRQFMDWRMGMKIESRGHTYKAAHNTALLEMKFFAFVLNEAVRREFIQSNPLARTGIGKRAPKEKPELTDEDIAKIHAAAMKAPRWMLTAFLIGLYTGCRFSECEIPLARLDFDAETLTIADAKRPDTDPKKLFRVPMHPGLREHLVPLREEQVTCKLGGDTNGRINALFRKAGVNATFHSLRVTFIQSGRSSP